MRLLGIDFGAARTGLSLSDPHALTCAPLEVVHERDLGRLVQRIRQVVLDHEVTELVVGHPRPLGGGTNPQLQAAEAFARSLATELGLPVHLWDERFTSKMAAAGPSRWGSPPESGSAAGRGRSRRVRRDQPRGSTGATPRDAVAACHMLQSYLDSQAHERARRAP